MTSPWPMQDPLSLVVSSYPEWPLNICSSRNKYILDTESLSRIYLFARWNMCLPTWCSGKEFSCQCRRHKRLFQSLVKEDQPGEGNANPLWCSCLESSMDKGAWQSTGHGVAKSQTQYSTSPPHPDTYTHKVEYSCRGSFLNQVISLLGG